MLMLKSLAIIGLQETGKLPQKQFGGLVELGGRPVDDNLASRLGPTEDQDVDGLERLGTETMGPLTVGLNLHSKPTPPFFFHIFPFLWF